MSERSTRRLIGRGCARGPSQQGGREGQFGGTPTISVAGSSLGWPDPLELSLAAGVGVWGRKSAPSAHRAGFHAPPFSVGCFCPHVGLVLPAQTLCPSLESGTSDFCLGRAVWGGALGSFAVVMNSYLSGGFRRHGLLTTQFWASLVSLGSGEGSAGLRSLRGLQEGALAASSASPAPGAHGPSRLGSQQWLIQARRSCWSRQASACVSRRRTGFWFKVAGGVEVTSGPRSCAHRGARLGTA